MCVGVTKKTLFHYRAYYVSCTMVTATLPMRVYVYTYIYPIYYTNSVPTSSNSNYFKINRFLITVLRENRKYVAT
jgi:hypothetical protein